MSWHGGGLHLLYLLSYWRIEWDHNEFWQYLGNEAKDVIKYLQVNDFNLDFIEDNSLDFTFSYDVFCHLSYSSIETYLNSLYKKSKPGGKLLIMYADPAKYLKSEPENKYHVIKYLPEKKVLYKISNKLLISDALEDCDIYQILNQDGTG